jgi:hypothetical protein
VIRASALRPAVLALAGVLLAGALTTLGGTGAWAASSVTVTNEDGGATADPDYATSVTVRGSGFQSIRNGFGGVYVLFGWVDGGSSWKPSNGGQVGADYRYVPDSEAKDNAGFQRFVAFPGSDTASAAHAVMTDDGSWSVDMVIPGASFESRDREGAVTSVDCLAVTCGIITIGAHGVKNANNETFTPIRFVAPATGSGTGSGSGTASATPEPTAAAVGEVRVGVASASVDAGTSIAFTGQGFTPGEQVVATLDNGLVSVGPLAAGAQGEVAGVLPVPYDVRGGTHVVTLTGAASAGVAQAEVAIVAPQTTVAEPAAEQTPMWLFVMLVCAIALALILIVVSVVVSLRRAGAQRRQRRELRAQEAPGGEGGAQAGPAAPPVVPEAPPRETRSPRAADGAADAPTVPLSVGAGDRS